MDPQALLRTIPKQPTSQDFAVVLGLAENENGVPVPNTELNRLNMILALQARNRLEQRDLQDAVWARFCALYLPATVAKFLNPPPSIVPGDSELTEDFILNNAYFEMLVGMQHTPYLSKYLRSSDPRASDNKRCARVLAERITTLAPRWEQHVLHPPTNRPPRFYYDSLGSALQLLSTICMAYVKQDINIIVPKETKDALSVFLTRWEKKHRNVFLGEVSSRLLMQFNLDAEKAQGRDGMKSEVKRVRKIVGGWDKCGLPNCSKKDALKACGRCKTVRYCCPEHQKTHWSLEPSSHKYQCHATLY